MAVQHELNLLGAIGSEVRYVFARHESWTGLSSTVRLANEFDENNHPLKIWFGHGSGAGENSYEGCCVFECKWWMGGTGTAKNNAGQVWWEVVRPNQNGKHKSHQYWQHQRLIKVDHPSFPIPNEELQGE